MSKKTKAASKKRRFNKAVREVRGEFHRAKNQGPYLKSTHLAEAGYPFVDLPRNLNTCWAELHDLCKDNFRTEQGGVTYTWFGSRFFFQTQDDANLFKTLWLLV